MPTSSPRLAVARKVLPVDFFNRRTLTVAKDLLGKLLVHQSPHGTIVGRIVETEGYLADDPACHAYQGPTPRCAVMFGPPGQTYVYFTYGMYHCFNVITEKEGTAGAVLVRAVEPVEGMAAVMKNFKGWPKKMDTRDPQRLFSGPGKLCVAYGFDRSHNNLRLGLRQPIQIWDAPALASKQVSVCPRIGISQNADAPYRFYISGHPSVSKP